MSKLPYDAQVEYIETTPETGSATIHLNEYVIDGFDNDIFMDVEINGYQADWVIVAGSGSTSGNSCYRVSHGNASSLRMFNGSHTDSFAAFTTVYGQRYNISLYHDYKYKINEISGTLPSASGNKNVDPIRIFGSTNVTYMKFYSFRWVKAGKTMVDLIPVRIGNEGALYNKVNGKIYRSNVEGASFVLGPDIENK